MLNQRTNSSPSLIVNPRPRNRITPRNENIVIDTNQLKTFLTSRARERLDKFGNPGCRARQNSLHPANMVLATVPRGPGSGVLSGRLEARIYVELTGASHGGSGIKVEGKVACLGTELWEVECDKGRDILAAIVVGFEDLAIRNVEVDCAGADVVQGEEGWLENVSWNRIWFTLGYAAFWAD